MQVLIESGHGCTQGGARTANVAVPKLCDNGRLTLANEYAEACGQQARSFTCIPVPGLVRIINCMGVYEILEVQDKLDGDDVLCRDHGPQARTFCMFGPHGHKPPPSAGLVPRAVQQVLDFVDQQHGVTLHCSFFEVYLDKVRDFLSKAPNDFVKESPGGDLLSYRKITTASEALQILRLGLKLRVAANTRLNEHSSRSHAIFSLLLRQEDSGIRQRKLTLVDLAGSEKVWQSGSVGGRLEEAKKINSSLSALGHVIEALADRRAPLGFYQGGWEEGPGSATLEDFGVLHVGNPYGEKRDDEQKQSTYGEKRDDEQKQSTKGDWHVPFRDSRLTRILEESLGGNCRTTLLVACSPSQLHLTETLSSLRFAARAKKIENMVGITLRPALEVSPNTRHLERRIAQLRRELARLEHRRAGLCGDQAAFLPRNAADRRRTPSPGKRPERASGGPNAGVAVKSTRKEVPEALPLPASAASSYRSTATGTSSTASVAAVSLGGSASGTPLSRDPEHPELSVADEVVRSPRVLPPRRTGYSFIIEATPVECHPKAPKPLTQNDATYEAPEEEEVVTTSAALERHAAALSQRCADLAAKLSRERQRCSTASVHTEAPLMATPIRIRELPSPKGTPSLEARGRSTTASSASRLASCLTGESRPRHSTLSFGQQVWISRSEAASAASLSPVRALSPMSRSPAAKSGRVLSQYLFSVPDDGRPLQVSTSMSPLQRATRRVPFSTQLSGAISAVNHW
ncbi:unnamed protein product [Cladocopium goreaui]|uniref:Kinesin-1 heavy chain (Conventional kinesin heavy chain) (Ubiquitous kinesin heavy chain) (UKHC) n=1 Tax=Cladocopium goreaui TaxID=2562237 RepID=A0A9P1FLG3_9DINO|nr:unnamed protein product [Cladocopium goreaui]